MGSRVSESRPSNEPVEASRVCDVSAFPGPGAKQQLSFARCAVRAGDAVSTLSPTVEKAPAPGMLAAALQTMAALGCAAFLNSGMGQRISTKTRGRVSPRSDDNWLAT
jgi:hypothetical protein